MVLDVPSSNSQPIRRIAVLSWIVVNHVRKARQLRWKNLKEDKLLKRLPYTGVELVLILEKRVAYS